MTSDELGLGPVVLTREPEGLKRRETGASCCQKPGLDHVRTSGPIPALMKREQQAHAG